MIRPSSPTPDLRGALAGVSLASILFLAVAGGLHVHDGHASDHCDLCHQLDNVSLDAPVVSIAVRVTRMADLAPNPGQDQPSLAFDSGDPARGPPSLS